MDDAQLGEFVAGCMQSLQQKQSDLGALGVALSDRFVVDLSA